MTEGWNPKRILLIEDENSVLSALKLLLDALGYSVTGFSVPREALAFAQADGNTVDICICDLRMPGMNGLEVLIQMKLIRPAMPFILMSAHATQDETDKAARLGADAFLSKPFSPEDLARLIAGLAARGLTIPPKTQVG